MRTFLQWFALILPILFVLLPHKVHKVIDACGFGPTFSPVL